MKRPDDSRLRPVSTRTDTVVPPAPPIRASSPTSARRSPSPRPPSRAKKERAVRPSEAAPSPSAQARKVRRDYRKAVRQRRLEERDDIRRFTARVRRRRLAVLIAVCGVLVLGAFVAFGTFTPVMALTSISVVGTQRVDAKIIQDGVASQLGKPLPLVDMGLIESVIARQPLVESFAIESRPPHDLIIRITERQPVGYLRQGDEFLLVDAAGVTIAQTPTRDVALPLFDVKGNSATAEGFVASVQVLAALPADLRAQVDHIAATTTDDVTLFLNPSGSRVLWGGPEESGLKARTLTALIANYPLGSVRQYDVSAPGAGVVS